MVMHGNSIAYGVFEFLRMLIGSIDREKFSVTGLFIGVGPLSENLKGQLDESVILSEDPFVPLSIPGKPKFYLPNMFNKAQVLGRSVTRMVGAIRRLKLDVLHVHMYPLHLLAGMAARAANIPCIWHWHGSCARKGLSSRIIKTGFSYLADSIPCISGYVAGTLPDVGRRKAVVVYNGVPTDRIASGQRAGELRKLLGVSSDRPVIGMFSSIVPLKGHEFLIRAAVEVRRSHPDAVFAIVGAETAILRSRMGLEDQLKRLVGELGVAEHIRFVGLLPDSWAYMGDCDIVCMPTVPIADRAEGFGLSMAEAMAAGVPVIATACGGPPEVIEEGVSGFLVPPRDPSALAGAVSRLLADPDLRKRMGQAARQRIRERFDISLTTRSIEKVYSDVVAGRFTGDFAA